MDLMLLLCLFSLWCWAVLFGLWGADVLWFVAEEYPSMRADVLVDSIDGKTDGDSDDEFFGMIHEWIMLIIISKYWKHFKYYTIQYKNWLEYNPQK